MTGLRAFFTRLWNTPEIRAAISAYLALRIVTLLVATGVYLTQPERLERIDNQPVYYLYNEVVTSPEPLRSLIAPWYRWDTGWYIYIAHEGFGANEFTYAFPPLYPVLIRLTAAVTGDYLLAALIVSNLACIAFFVLLYRRFAGQFGHYRTRWTLRLLVLFPTAFYLVAGYADSIGLALALAAWESLEHRRYTRAGLLGLLAGLARPQLWVIALPMLYSLWQAYRADHPDTPLSRTAHARLLWTWGFRHIGALWALAGALLGTAIYLFLPSMVGVGATDTAGTGGWSSGFALPGAGFLNAVAALLEGKATLLETINMTSFLLLVLLTLAGWKKLDPGNWLYMAGTVFVLSLILNLRVHLEGMLRYVVHVYPVFFLLAGWIIPRRLLRVTYFVVAGAGSLLAIFLFTNWVWIG